jgi:isoleucyl-tRNA synthetase
MAFDSVAFKTVVSNGLVLDKAGNKMSKRLGNAVNPFETISIYGPDATRWYMITNSQPWDNLRFDIAGVDEVRRKFLGTLYNTYAFFALYANIDGFTYQEDEIPIEERSELDRWIISELNSLILEVDEAYSSFEPTRAGRAIQYFVTEHLSNWYVRLSRRRFWKGSYSKDKVVAYQTLYRCLEVIAQLASPVAPFICERLFTDLNNVSGKLDVESVHLTDFPLADKNLIDKDLEERMELAQQLSSMVLSLRKKNNIRVRQPLNKIMVPVLNEHFREVVSAVEDLILSEVNVKELEYLTDDAGILVKKIKPNFKSLGPRYGKMMKQLAGAINQLSQEDIRKLEKEGNFILHLGGEEVVIGPEDVEISTEDIPGWSVANQDHITVALDLTITPQLQEEGLARELINRIQNLRKDKGLEVTDRILLHVERNEKTDQAFSNFKDYICSETLANMNLEDNIQNGDHETYELVEGIEVKLALEKEV